MPRISTSGDWSEAVTLTTTSMIQAQGGRVAISTGAGAPSEGEEGTVLQANATAILSPGAFRHRTPDRGNVYLHHQAWPA
jgi:hypothetical protein